MKFVPIIIILFYTEHFKRDFLFTILPCMIYCATEKQSLLNSNNFLWIINFPTFFFAFEKTRVFKPKRSIVAIWQQKIS